MADGQVPFVGQQQPVVAPAVPPGPAPVVVPVPAVQFALTPARVSNAVIDYANESGRKQFKSATAALPEKFNLESSELQLFLQMLRDRVYEQDWSDIILIPIGGDVNNLKSLTDHYGEIPLEDVKAHALTYVFGLNRAAQDSMQLYSCLMASLTKGALNKVRLKTDDFNITTPLTGSMVSGTALLKVIIGISHIDTMATVSQLRTRLSSLDAYMVSVQSDVDKFNMYVNTCLESLHARGEETQDLMVNLFKGYAKCSDKAFRDYISTKENFYEENGAISTGELMMFALTKFQTLSDKGQWNTPNEADAKIIALQAEVSRLKNKRATPTSSYQKQHATDSKTKEKKDVASPKTKRVKPPWMLVKPAGTEPHNKEVLGKSYYWCDAHESWGRHTPDKCEGTNIPFKDLKNPGAPKKASSGSTSKSMRLADALAAVAQSREDGE